MLFTFILLLFVLNFCFVISQYHGKLQPSICRNVIFFMIYLCVNIICMSMYVCMLPIVNKRQIMKGFSLSLGSLLLSPFM